jgi:hypothetical protein
MLYKQFWKLVLGSVIRIRVDNTLSVGQVPLKDKRVHRVNDNVVAAVDDQNRLFDFLKVGVELASWRSPLLQSRYLSQSDLLVNRGISVFLARSYSL